MEKAGNEKGENNNVDRVMIDGCNKFRLGYLYPVCNRISKVIYNC